ncbi:hypothetical protein CDD83_6191 [Cordyceps sp. RAO-2017]|nr:hypothetical protein CDD83_6191 [Cordyceps sp. RAO-2017]
MVAQPPIAAPSTGAAQSRGRAQMPPQLPVRSAAQSPLPAAANERLPLSYAPPASAPLVIRPPFSPAASPPSNFPPFFFSRVTAPKARASYSDETRLRSRWSRFRLETQPSLVLSQQRGPA